MEAGHDSPDRHPERLGGVLVREAFDIDQEHHLTVERGQLLDRRHHLGGRHLVEHVSLRLGALVTELVVEDELTDVVQAHVLFARPFEAVPEEVAHDGEEPGLHVGARLVAVLVAEGAKVCLLDQVLRLVGIARQAQRAAIKGVEVRQRFFGECGWSLALAFRHQ